MTFLLLLLLGALMAWCSDSDTAVRCAARRGHSAQQCLLTAIDRWRASLDQNGTCAVLLTDLSKAFDCLPHYLLIAKLHAYGYDLPSLKLLNSYLRNWHQCVKIYFYSYGQKFYLGSHKDLS